VDRWQALEGGPLLIVIGEVLLVVCSLSYLVWWAIAALLPKASLPALGATIVGGVLVGALLLYVTSGVGHRPVTTELPLIVVWATVQLAAGITLWTAGVLRAPAASAWIVATVIATLVGLTCYLMFYRLEPIPAYWIGMVPLAVDGVVAAILAAIVTLTRVP
jgi:drug/metabolite transporter (DMT)-like permease